MKYRILLLLLVLNSTAAFTNTLPLQLAQTYAGGIDVSEYFASEKLDGIRARWTGTQLVTRNGNPIHSPAWFTLNWPEIPMDGELWTKEGDFEAIASIVLSHTPDERWRSVTMMVFDLPDPEKTFTQRVAHMQALLTPDKYPTLKMIEQTMLNSTTGLDTLVASVILKGGEGLMLHHRDAYYQDGRNPGLLKVKHYKDDEARVIAHLPGKGKYQGVMGSLLVETREGKQFKIGTGFSFAQRHQPPAIGSWITYKYYGLTQNGIPRFASFLHRRPESDRPR